jgi:carbonic anhydrase
MIDTRLRATEPLKPDYILDLQQATQQILWIGCCDSNAKESTVLNILSEEIFVLRNLGNMIINGDLSCETTVKHAILDLRVCP